MSTADTSVSNLNTNIWDRPFESATFGSLQNETTQSKRPHKNKLFGNIDYEQRQKMAWVIVDVCKWAILIGLIVITNMLVNPDLSPAEIGSRAWTNLTSNIKGVF